MLIEKRGCYSPIDDLFQLEMTINKPQRKNNVFHIDFKENEAKIN